MFQLPYFLGVNLNHIVTIYQPCSTLVQWVLDFLGSNDMVSLIHRSKTPEIQKLPKSMVPKLHGFPEIDGFNAPEIYGIKVLEIHSIKAFEIHGFKASRIHGSKAPDILGSKAPCYLVPKLISSMVPKLHRSLQACNISQYKLRFFLFLPPFFKNAPKLDF